MPEFHPHRGGGVVLVLEAEEAALLRRLAGELRAVIVERGRKSDDAVTGRLFPDAYEDPADEAAYRDLISDDLEREKLRALDTVSTALDGAHEVTIVPDDLSAWLASLTDLRLAIGTRMEVDEDRMSSEIDPDDPNAAALATLHWLGWIQEGILSTHQPEGGGADD